MIQSTMTSLDSLLCETLKKIGLLGGVLAARRDHELTKYPDPRAQQEEPDERLYREMRALVGGTAYE